MLFANSVMLWGLLAISVPVIIHLFNLQRYKKVYFTNVRFLQQLQQQSRRQSVLRHWLALLFRILVITSLVLAFARPYIPSEFGPTGEAGGLASIYIDNSFSMESEGPDGFLIDEAISKAGQIIGGHSASDRFNLLTNDFSGIHNRLVTADEMRVFLGDISISPAVRTLEEVLNRQYDALNREVIPDKALYVISDFQRSTSVLNGFTADTNIRHFMIPLEPVQYSNLSIDSCWFETPAQQPGQVLRLHVTVTNHGGSPREQLPVRLILNGSQRALASFNINANESSTETLSFSIRETGLHFGFLELNDYPVTFDDRLYLSFNVMPSINVMSIFDREQSHYLRALFGPDTLFVYTETNIRQLNFSELRRQQLIVLNGLNSISSGLAAELTRFVESGGSLFVIPSKQIDKASYNNLMQTFNTVSFSDTDTTRMRVGELNVLHPVYHDVFESRQGVSALLPPDTDLPRVNYRYKLTLPPRKDVQNLMTLRNNEPFLTAGHYGDGKIYVLASPLHDQSTSFPVHAVFVPTLYKMALLSTPTPKIYHVAGVDESVNIGNLSPGNAQVFHLEAADGDLKFIPGHRTLNYNTHLYALDAIQNAGNYFLTVGEDTLQVLSFNYDRRESVPDYLSEDELYDMAKTAGITNFAVISQSEHPVDQMIRELNRGRQLWKYFIIAALVFLIAEIVALRFLP